MFRQKRILRAMLAGILLLGMFVSACDGVQQKQGEQGEQEEKIIKIGVISPESGSSAELGQAQHRAVEMAINEINEGGLAGPWRLQAYFEDDEGNPTKSSNATNKLLQETKVDILIAAIMSSCTLADMVHTERAGIPQITAGSTGASITAQGSPWIFRTAVNDSLQADAQVQYAKDVLGITKAATFTEATDYGQSGAELLKAAAAKADIELVVNATYNVGDKDFKPQLLSMLEGNSEAIFMWGNYAEAALIAKQARLLGFEGQFFGGSGLAASKLIELGEEAVQGMLITQSFLPDSDETTVKDFVDEFSRKYGKDPIPHAAQAYDTVYIIADAVKRADSTSPDALAEAIRTTSGLELVTGSPKFNENGDDVGKRVLITGIEGEKFVLIEAIVVNAS